MWKKLRLLNNDVACGQQVIFQDDKNLSIHVADFSQRFSFTLGLTAQLCRDLPGYSLFTQSYEENSNFWLFFLVKYLPGNVLVVNTIYSTNLNFRISLK